MEVEVGGGSDNDPGWDDGDNDGNSGAENALKSYAVVGSRSNDDLG